MLNEHIVWEVILLDTFETKSNINKLDNKDHLLQFLIYLNLVDYFIFVANIGR